MIDEQQVMLKVGEIGPNGVQLLSVDGTQAILRVDGQTQAFSLSSYPINGLSHQKSVKISRNENGHYFVKATVNGHSASMMVDTGATVVGMNSHHANELGVDYQSGKIVAISTASGQTQGFLVTLKALSVGGLTVKNVKAVINEGDFPKVILLGMSFLRHVRMRDNGDTLYLEAKY